MTEPRQAVTKWDLISESERQSLEKTPLGKNCSGCEEPLLTEADFARHFLLYNRRHRNVGYCPTTGPRGLTF